MSSSASTKRCSDDIEDGEVTYAKATQAELKKDWDRAFGLYIKAAETFLHLSRTHSEEAYRHKCKAHAAKAVERAEKLKTVKRDLTPIPVNYFSEQEQERALRKSSLINRIKVPLWRDLSAAETSTDGIEPALSSQQHQSLVAWRRPTDVNTDAQLTSSSLSPQDIVQHTVTDCSVCSSIVVCVEHNRRFNSKLGIASLYPQNADGLPYSTTDGRYLLRFFLNGGPRCVSIDDRLPFTPNGVLMGMSTGNQNVTWPSLVEKAFMKLHGGYEFAGSNSCIDLHVLTGWIPEHVDTQSSHFERESTWARILAGFTKGHCILTLGTHSKTNVQWNGIQLLPAHSYAVIDVREEESRRFLTVLDPWITAHNLHALGDDVDTLSLAGLLIQERSRTMDMTWEEVYSIFHGIYLSWDPGMFGHRLTYHGVWRANNRADEIQSAHRRLRLKSSTQGKENEIWVLLTRHLVNTHRPSEFISMRVHSESHDEAANHPLKSYRDHLMGEYTNSPHVLFRERVSDATSLLSIVASYDGDYEDVGFTVTAYSSMPLAWEQDDSSLRFSKLVEGAFVAKSAGGNWTYPSFMINPQYHLRISPEQGTTNTTDMKKARLQITAQAARDIPLNVSVVWSQGQRMTDLVEKDIAASSAAYTYGFAHIAKELPPGDFTVILSAFEPSHIGPYVLQVESSNRIQLTQIPQEGAGLYVKSINGTWDAETAGGGPSTSQYRSNPIFEVQVPTSARLSIRLQLVRRSVKAPLNVTLFRSNTHGSLGPHVATSGSYSDAVSGVVVDQTSLSPGTYLLVPSTWSSGVQAAFKIIVYSNVQGVSITPRAHR